MSRVLRWSASLAVAGVIAGCGQPAVATGRVTGGLWGRVIEVPGLGVLSTGKHGFARINALSCASAGNCLAGGDYVGEGSAQKGTVAAERNGRWGTATGVPGLPALNKGRFGGVLAVSCTSVGNCVAGGYYADADLQDNSGFVISESNGRWGKIMTVPPGDDSEIDSISCTSAGNCLAGGQASAYYFSSDFDFVVQERNGHWGKLTKLPGLAALNKGGDAGVNSVWCGSAGNCVAGGFYTAKGGAGTQGFVAVERNGVWGAASAVPGLAALNIGGNAAVNSVSCASAGNCVAGGNYAGGHDAGQSMVGFVAVERNGTWATAAAVPGLAALDKGGGPTTVLAVSCARAGRCAAGGFYSDSSHHRQGFVITAAHGRWGTPVPLPGLAALNAGGAAVVSALSCASADSCAVGGGYTDSTKHHQGFVTQSG